MKKIYMFIAITVICLLSVFPVATLYASSVDVAVVDVTAPVGSVTLAPGESGQITINMTVTGKQDGTATFKVYRDWTLSGGVFKGSNPETFTVSPQAGGTTTYFSTTGTVTVASGQGVGTFILAVSAFDITNSNTTGAKLSDGSDSNYQVTVSAPVDTTPPVITPTINGTLGNNGWYISDVTISWDVSDPESGIASSSGAEQTILTSDTAGTTLTCSATNGAGLSNSESVTIKIDKTAPVVTWGIPTPTPNANGWNNTNVEYPFTATDTGGSGIDNSLSDSSPVTISTEGSAVTGSATVYDLAGNSTTSTSQAVNIDKTDPTLSWGSITPSPNTNGWNNTNVTISFTANDLLSGVDFTTPLSSPLSFTSEGAGQTQNVTVTDKAGNSKTFTSAAVNIDKTAPVVTITLPDTGNGVGKYLLNEIVSATWSATDTTSGVVQPTSGTILLDTSTIGTKTVSVPPPVVEDYAGNTAELKSQNYNIIYNFSGVLQPINNDGSSVFKFKSTIPVKFQLKDANGNFITNAIAKIYVMKVSDGVVGYELEAISTSAATEGNLFRYDFSDNQYIFNLGTKTLSTGTWQIRIQLNDDTSKFVFISLR